MGVNSQAAKKTAEIYQKLDSQLRTAGNSCQACGKCCDFKTYDHRLFVTTAEMIYLVEKLGSNNIKKMPTGVCPYNINGKCSIYENRFASCRIFQCKGDVDFQSKLSEWAIKEFKAICEKLNLYYRYTDLASALNSFNG
jgi:Fe-S-cluster containining protein